MIKLFAPLLAALVAWAAVPQALAQDFPNKALRMVVAYPPGASSDTLARSVAQKMSQSIGQPIVVENRAGASGNIGTEYVARQSGDGYTFMLGTDATHAANMHLTATPSFHPLKDFTALTLAALNPIVLVVNPAVPVRSVRELIDYGRANPDKIAYGSSGAGSPHHLAGELLKQSSGVPFLHVPYKGGAQAVTDVLGGQVPMVFSSLITVLPHIRSGKLRAIAVTQSARYAGLPDVPTFAETLPGFEMNSWLGFFAPAGVPEAIARRLNEELIKALRDPEVQPKLDAGGLIVATNSLQDFAAMVRKEYEQRGRLISAAGVKLQ